MEQNNQAKARNSKIDVKLINIRYKKYNEEKTKENLIVADIEFVLINLKSWYKLCSYSKYFYRESQKT